MACKHFAPNGKPSILYDELAKQYGDTIADRTFVLTRTNRFKDAHRDHPKDVNGEPTVGFMKDKGLVYAEGQLFKAPPNVINADEKVASLKQAFSAAGVDVSVEINENLTTAGKVMKKNNRVTAQFNPELLESDTIYHEFGHILVEGLGDDHPLVKSGIKMLEGTDLWNKIAFFNPDLSGSRLAKEVLTSAIGVEAERLYNTKADQARWKVWLKTFFEKLGQLLGIEPNAVQKLAKQLVQGKLDQKLDLKLRDYVEYQRSMRIVRNKFAQKHDVLTQAISILEQKIHDYFRNLSYEERDNNKHYREFSGLRDSLLKWQQLDMNKGIVEFLTFAYRQTASLETRTNDILNNVHPNKPLEIDAKLIKQIMNYNSVFGDILDDMILLTETDEALRTSLKDITELENASDPNTKIVLDGSLYNNIQEIRARYLRVMSATKQIGILYLSQQMFKTGIMSKFEGYLRDQLAREYTGDNIERFKDPKQRKQAEKDRTAFVNERIAELKKRPTEEGNFTELERLANEYYINFLQHSPGDISWLERMFLTGNYVNEETVQVASEKLDEADYETRMESINEFRKAAKIFEAFDKATSGTTQAERHAALLEDEIEFDYATFEFKKTGRKRQNLVGKVYSQFFEIKRNLWLVVEKASEEHGEDSIEFEDAKRNYFAFLNRFTDRHKNADGEWISTPNSKMWNPQWSNEQGTGIMDRDENDPIRQAYEYLTDRLKKDDERIPPAYRLVQQDESGGEYYRLPSVVKHSQIEIVGDEGVGGYMRNKLRRIKKALEGNPEDSTEYGTDPTDSVPNDFNRILAVQADEQGEESHFVPINLRRRISPEDQSFDLFTVVLLNNAMAANFENKQDIAMELELLKEVLGDREMVRNDNIMGKGFRKKVNKVLENLGFDPTPITDKGEDSEAFKAFKNLLETRLYGLMNKGSVRANEIATALTSWTGTLLLSGNYLSAGANLMSGQLQTRIDAMSGQYINNVDLNYAHKEYVANIANLAKDLGQVAPVSKLGKLVELLNPMSEWEPVANKFVRNSILKRLYAHMDPSMLQSAGEHAIQTTMAIAVLHNAKAISITGKYLDKNFNETDNVKEAINMYEAFQGQNENGIIQLHEAVNGFEKGSIRVEGKKESIFAISRMIAELNKQLQGNYARNEIAEARRSPIGKVALVMRRWYPYTLVRRIRGIGTVKRSAKDLDIEETFFNRALGSTEEGYYTTWLRYMGQVWKNAKRIKMDEGRSGGLGFLMSLKGARAETKAEMLDYEKANMYRMYYDLAATVLYMALASVLVLLAKKMGDKDDRGRKAVFTLAYWILKAQRELMSYYNPNEVLRTVGTVSVVLPQLQQMVDLLLQLGSDITAFEVHRYSRGRRKGQSKLWKEFTDVFPILKQSGKDVEEQFSYMMNVKGW